MRNAEINRGDYSHDEEIELRDLPQFQRIQILWPVLKTGAASLRACEFAEKNAIQYRNQDSVIRGRMTPNVLR